MGMGMNIVFMIQAFLMMAFYLVGGVVVIILMIKGIQALNIYKKKANLEIMQLQKAASVEVTPVATQPAVEEVDTEEAK